MWGGGGGVVDGSRTLLQRELSDGHCFQKQSGHSRPGQHLSDKAPVLFTSCAAFLRVLAGLGLVEKKSQEIPLCLAPEAANSPRPTG